MSEHRFCPAAITRGIPANVRLSASVLAIFLVVTVAQTQGLSPAVSAEEYPLQPGDRVVVTLSGGAHFSYETMVSPEGKVFLQVPTEVEEMPFEVIDEVAVSGATLTEAEKLLVEGFSKYFKSTDVSLNLIELRTFSVLVAGEVLTAGVYEATPLTRVSQVLEQAELGGNASKSRLELTREGTHTTINLYDFELHGTPEGNPYVRDGDVIFVPRMEKSVVVRGAVYGVGVHGLRTSTLTVEQTRTSEGNYELEKGDRVSDILTKAGGIAPWADLAHGYLERFDPERATVTRRRLDLSKIISGRGSGEDILLMDRDVLVVPSLEDKIYVNGGVYNPGPFDYQPNLSVMDYVGLAGGATPRGNLKKTLVLRPDGTRTPAPMGAASPVLHRGDTILVPEVALKWWQDYVTLVTAVSSVVISWLIIAE